MKTLLAAGALLLATFVRPAAAHPIVTFGIGAFPTSSVIVGYPGFAPGYGYYPTGVFPGYQFPIAPSFGFARGGIYGHQFVPRDEGVRGYTFPGSTDWNR
ncbi:MAG TPA: hypothetical protein VFD84_02860 [Candidatus Binatia bacterium]|nr:hypothetical protein [Candidatus Binatia bacterium]